MSNEIEHLLTCFAEEAGEIATDAVALVLQCLTLGKCADKALRFGLLDQVTRDPNGPRGTEGPTNAERIHQETIDLLACYIELFELGALPSLGVSIIDQATLDRVNAKREKIRSFMSYARRVGALGNIPDLKIFPAFQGNKAEHPFRMMVEGPNGFQSIASGLTAEGLIADLSKTLLTADFTGHRICDPLPEAKIPDCVDYNVDLAGAVFHWRFYPAGSSRFPEWCLHKGELKPGMGRELPVARVLHGTADNPTGWAWGHPASTGVCGFKAAPSIGHARACAEGAVMDWAEKQADAADVVKKPKKHADEPDRCPSCNWSNGDLLNYGLPGGKTVWLCHGCAARKIQSLPELQTLPHCRTVQEEPKPSGDSAPIRPMVIRGARHFWQFGQLVGSPAWHLHQEDVVIGTPSPAAVYRADEEKDDWSWIIRVDGVLAPLTGTAPHLEDAFERVKKEMETNRLLLRKAAGKKSPTLDDAIQAGKLSLFPSYKARLIHPDYHQTDPPVVLVFPGANYMGERCYLWDDGSQDCVDPKFLVPVDGVPEPTASCIPCVVQGRECCWHRINVGENSLWHLLRSVPGNRPSRGGHHVGTANHAGDGRWGAVWDTGPGKIVSSDEFADYKLAMEAVEANVVFDR